MAIEVECVYCGEELKELGAILLSPPIYDRNGKEMYEKEHICKKCYRGITTL